MGIQEVHGIPSTDAVIQELHGILSTYPGVHWISSTDPSTLVLYWIPITSTRIASYPQHWSMNYTGSPALIQEFHGISSTDPWTTPDPQQWSMNYIGSPALIHELHRNPSICIKNWTGLPALIFLVFVGWAQQPFESALAPAQESSKLHWLHPKQFGWKAAPVPQYYTYRILFFTTV